MAVKLIGGIKAQNVDLEIAADKIAVDYAVYVDTRGVDAINERPSFGLTPTDEITAVNTGKIKTSSAGSSTQLLKNDDGSNSDDETRMYVLIGVCIFAFVVVVGLGVGYKIWKNNKTRNQVRIADESSSNNDEKKFNAKAPSALELK